MTSLSYQRFKGHATKYDIKSLGYNYRMDDIRASIGIVQLKKLNQDIIKRSELRKLYIDKLKNNSKIIIPFENNENFVSNYIFPIVLNNVNREEIRDRLDKKSIQTSIHYPSIHRFSVYEKDYLELPNTDYISKNEMTLPLYSNLKGEDIDYVTNSLLEILEQNHEE
jgi:dTDP-4-amino-4,6-dideoxygalactose transaminase